MSAGEKKRRYVQVRRAETAQQRTERMIEAALELFVEVGLEKMTLAAVAERAGVGVQTVIRRFGTKDGLVAATAVQMGKTIELSRAAMADPGSSPAKVIEILASQYERYHPSTAALLGSERSSAVLAQFAEMGRNNHTAWIRLAFAEALARVDEPRRHLVEARLSASTSFEVWFWLNQTEGLGDEDTRAAMVEMVEDALTRAERDRGTGG